MNCRCGCGGRNAHEHYRRGRECAFCRCPRYRPDLRRALGDAAFVARLVVDLWRGLGRRPTP